MQIMYDSGNIKIQNGDRMLDAKVLTLLKVAETRNFTKAAEALGLTQPAVSHHIAQLEAELGITLFLRKKGQLTLTNEGELAVQYARRISAMYDKLKNDLRDSEKHLTRLRVGITHTSESNLITEVLAKYSSDVSGISITITTDTIKNLYDALENYELDLAIVENRPTRPDLNSLMLGTDYLVCVLPNENPLAKRSMVTLNDLKKQRMILRLPSSDTRKLFESHLESQGESIDNFDVVLEVDNIATIKDLIRKDFGVSILARSACMDEVGKGKLTILPIENLGMIRETNLVYHKDFSYMDILQEIVGLYHETARKNK